MPQSLNDFWGAVMDDIELDVVSQVLVISCHETINSKTAHHKIEFKELSNLQFINSIVGPWEYAEITEVHASRTLSGLMQMQLVFWDEEAGLVAVAGSVEIDGKLISL